MIAKSVTVVYDYVMDEATKIAVCGDKYAKFDVTVDENGAEVVSDSCTEIAPCEVAHLYFNQKIKIPDEFVAVKGCIQSRIEALQSVL